MNVLPEKQIGPDRDRVLRHVEVRADFVELHRLDAGGFVLARLDHAVLDRVVDLVVRDHRRRHADGGERLAPDRRALHANLEALHLGEVAHRLVGEDVARAAAGEADQHHVALRGDFVGDRLQRVGVEHLVPVVEVAEQERRVDERRGLGERRHVRRRHDRVVDRDALVHVREVVLLEAELAVLVQDEVDRLAVVLDGQLLEFLQRPGERVAVVELDGAVQRDGLLRERAAERDHDRAAAKVRNSARKAVRMEFLLGW